VNLSLVDLLPCMHLLERLPSNTSCDHSWLTDHISYIVNTINSGAGAIRCLCALTSYLRTFHFWRLQSGFAYRTCNSTLPRQHPFAPCRHVTGAQASLKALCLFRIASMLLTSVVIPIIVYMYTSTVYSI